MSDANVTNGYADTWLDQDDYRYSCKFIVI